MQLRHVSRLRETVRRSAEEKMELGIAPTCPKYRYLNDASKGLFLSHRSNRTITRALYRNLPLAMSLEDDCICS
jgi:hypothetical protein